MRADHLQHSACLPVGPAAPAPPAALDVAEMLLPLGVAVAACLLAGGWRVAVQSLRTAVEHPAAAAAAPHTPRPMTRAAAALAAPLLPAAPAADHAR